VVFDTAWGDYCGLQFTSGVDVTFMLINTMDNMVTAQLTDKLDSDFARDAGIIDSMQFNTYDPFQIRNAGAGDMVTFYDPSKDTACPPEKPDCASEVFHGEQKTVGGSCASTTECAPPYVCTAGVCSTNDSYQYTPPPTGEQTYTGTSEKFGPGAACAMYYDCQSYICDLGVCK